MYFDNHPEIPIPRLVASRYYGPIKKSIERGMTDIKVTSPLRRFADYVTLYQLTAESSGFERLNSTYINYVQSMYDNARSRSMEVNNWIKQKTAQQNLIKRAMHDGRVSVIVRFTSHVGKQVAGFKNLFEYNLIEVENNQLLTVRSTKDYSSFGVKMNQRVKVTLFYNKDADMLQIQHVDFA